MFYHIDVSPICQPALPHDDVSMHAGREAAEGFLGSVWSCVFFHIDVSPVCKQALAHDDVSMHAGQEAAAGFLGCVASTCYL